MSLHRASLRPFPLPTIRRVEVGYSEEGRPLCATMVGSESADLRILIMAGQHGDEPLARVAVERFAAKLSQVRPDWSNARIATIANVNPDGSRQYTRHNASGIDLNRDHQLLASAETQAIHHFVQMWRPHLVVDVHTYPPRRKHLLRDHLVYCHDVFMDVPTNPSIRCPSRRDLSRSLLEPTSRQLNALGFRSGRYTLVKQSGRVRHSTPDVIDARNALALRYEIATLLVEGRQPTLRDPPDAAHHLLSALQVALQRIVTQACNFRCVFRRMSLPNKENRLVPIRSRYRADRAKCQMEFRDARSGLIRSVRLPGPFSPSLRMTRHVTLPEAYAVPLTATRLIDVLARHRFQSQRGDHRKLSRVESYWVDWLRPSLRPGRAPQRISLQVHPARRCLDGYVVFPLSQVGGHALAVYLEPESKYGLHRMPSTGLRLEGSSPFPVLRVV